MQHSSRLDVPSALNRDHSAACMLAARRQAGAVAFSRPVLWVWWCRALYLGQRSFSSRVVPLLAEVEVLCLP